LAGPLEKYRVEGLWSRRRLQYPAQLGLRRRQVIAVMPVRLLHGIHSAAKASSLLMPQLTGRNRRKAKSTKPLSALDSKRSSAGTTFRVGPQILAARQRHPPSARWPHL